MANVQTTLEFMVSVPAGATTFYVPVKERCKVIGAKVTSGTARGVDKEVKISKGALELGTIELTNEAGKVDVADMVKFDIKATKDTIIEDDGVITVLVDAGTASVMSFVFTVDPFCIQQFVTE